MDQGHGANAVSRVIERLERLRIADVSGLQTEQTRNDLQIIFHPMVHFSEQDIFLMQGGRELRFRVLSLDDFRVQVRVGSGQFRRPFVNAPLQGVMRVPQRLLRLPALEDFGPQGLVGVAQGHGPFLHALFPARHSPGARRPPPAHAPGCAHAVGH